MEKPARIGIISDTHGLLRAEAVRALEGSELIIHAGDVGNAGILDELRRIAPVTAVHGNVDRPPLNTALPATALVEARDTAIYVLHDLQQLEVNPLAAGIDIVISGHTHKPVHVIRNGVHHINPGSAGPRRFKLPVTVARLNLHTSPWQVEIIDLGC